MVAVELMSLPSEEAAEEARALEQTLLDSQDKVDSYLKSLLWQLWPMDAKPEEGRPLQPSATPGVATATTPTKPGPYWFRIDSKDRRRNVCFALTILTGQDLNLILHQQDCGRIFVFQFMEHDGPNREVDPLKTRRLDMAQRFLMGGELGQGSSTLEPLLVDPHGLDPIAGSLGGHLLVKQGQIDRAGALGERLIELHPTLPDGHVLPRWPCRPRAGRATPKRHIARRWTSGSRWSPRTPCGLHPEPHGRESHTRGSSC